MKNILRIFLADNRRIRRNVVAVVVVMGLSILPCLYAWFNIFSNWDPYGADATSRMKVGVVSLDRGVSLGNAELNVGDSLLDGLKSNHTIGWEFVDSQEELEKGVEDGSYYAGFLVPKDFTQQMLSFATGEVRHPELIYYENQKKNAIAPKITGKAKSAVQEQINTQFLTTISEGVMKFGNVAADAQQKFDGQSFYEQLVQLRDTMGIYEGLLQSFRGILNAAGGVLDATENVIPGIEDTMKNSRETLLQMQNMALDRSGNAQALTQMISYSFEVLDQAISDLDTKSMEVLERMQQQQNADADLAALQGALPYMKELFLQSVQGWNHENAQAQIDAVNQGFEQIGQDLSTVGQLNLQTENNLEQLRADMQAQFALCKQNVQSIRQSFEGSVLPSLNSQIQNVQQTMLDVQSMINSQGGDFSEIEQVIISYKTVLAQGAEQLDASLEKTAQVKSQMDTLLADISLLLGGESYKEVVQALETKPDMLAEFVAEPVQIQVEELYAIEHYGSAMTPFYTILALWVGALILVAIVHVKVKDDPQIGGAKPYEKFFGRYLTFFAIGQMQALLTVLGELFYIKIQCAHPFLLWLAAAITSLMFTLFIYALTVAFGNVGEALAVVIMVIQVAGAGGTFPIETLPRVYQGLYRFLPFTHGMNAMREAIAGLYGSVYLESLAVLGIYVLVSLLIGLIIAIPFRKINQKIEKSKQASDLMI